MQELGIKRWANKCFAIGAIGAIGALVVGCGLLVVNGKRVGGRGSEAPGHPPGDDSDREGREAGQESPGFDLVDGAVDVPASFEPDVVALFEKCDLALPHNGRLIRSRKFLVVACTGTPRSVRTGTVTTCRVSSRDRFRSVFSPSTYGFQAALTVATDKEVIAATSAGIKRLRLVVGLGDQLPRATYTQRMPSGTSITCDGFWTETEVMKKVVAEFAAQEDQVQDDQAAADNSSSSTRTEPARTTRKGKGLGKSCDSTSECEEGRECKQRTARLRTCQ